MRISLALGLALLLSGCVSERHFVRDSWPFGNPNAPLAQSENAQRALGKVAVVTPIPPQAGDVWPGPVQPMPTLGQMQQNMNLPLGQAYSPSLPSPYPPGETPPADETDGTTSTSTAPGSDGGLYATPSGAVATPVPAVPGDAR